MQQNISSIIRSLMGNPNLVFHAEGAQQWQGLMRPTHVQVGSSTHDRHGRKYDKPIPIMREQRYMKCNNPGFHEKGYRPLRVIQGRSKH